MSQRKTGKPDFNAKVSTDESIQPTNIMDVAPRVSSGVWETYKTGAIWLYADGFAQNSLNNWIPFYGYPWEDPPPAANGTATVNNDIWFSNGRALLLTTGDATNDIRGISLFLPAQDSKVGIECKFRFPVGSTSAAFYRIKLGLIHRRGQLVKPAEGGLSRNYEMAWVQPPLAHRPGLYLLSDNGDDGELTQVYSFKRCNIESTEPIVNLSDCWHTVKAVFDPVNVRYDKFYCDTEIIDSGSFGITPPPGGSWGLLWGESYQFYVAIQTTASISPARSLHIDDIIITRDEP